MEKNSQDTIKTVISLVKNQFAKDTTGHDWWHIYRVHHLAKRIAQEETGVNHFVVELGALLHDIADWKFHDGDDKAGSKKAREILESLHVDKTIIDHVCDIIDHVSFKGAGVADAMPTLEGKIVQDADRLDALGAIGIARTFAYGGAKGRPMHDPDNNPKNHESFDQYKKSNSSALNHFYEKLLLLKDRLHTNAAKKMAQERHSYMEEFVKRFLVEWDGLG